MQKKITFLFVVFCCSAFAAVCYAQKTAWLKGFWSGKAYLPNVDTQFYYLTLEIVKVKNESFEGVLKTMKPSDSIIHFDSEVKGIIKGKKFGMIRTRIIYARNDVQNNWKVVNCNNCKPPEWEFLFEKEKFIIRGAVKNCAIECNWVTELSKYLKEFDSTEQEELYALLDDRNKTAKSLFVTATNNKNIPPATVVVTEEKRTSILNPGTIVTVEKTTNAEKNTPSIAQTKPALEISRDIYIPQRITFAREEQLVLPQQKNYTALQNLSPAFTANTPLLKVNNSSHIPYRTPLIAAGSIELLWRKQKSPIYQRTNKQMTIAKPYLVLPDTRFTASTLAATAAVVEKRPAELPVIKATPPPLPEGFKERKQNVVRTLTVNTDSILLRVYDNGIVDGDIVSIIYNGDVVIDKLSLTTRIVEIKIPVDVNAVNSLVFHAHNLGEFPPNTAKLEIVYGNKREELTVSSDLTVSSTIDIVRK